MKTSSEVATGGSQTLARGLRAITVIGEAETPLTVAELAAELGIHRSMAYRLVRTLEQQGFVERSPAGSLELGLRIAGLARSVAKDLQTAAAPVLASVADELEMTAFLVVYDGTSAVTLGGAEPRHAPTTVAQRPGSRHALGQGAPGRVIQSQLYPVDYPPRPFEQSTDEVIPGLRSFAVPLSVPAGRPTAIAVIYVPRDIDEARVVQTLTAAAKRISEAMH